MVLTAHQRPHRRGVAPRRAATLALGLVALAAGLVAPLGPGGSLAAPDDCAEAQGANRIAVVVDFGTVPGSPGAVRRTCVALPAGADGITALTVAGYKLRFNSAGLLCAIGEPGQPEYPAAPACGERTAGGYRYWAYFTGTAGGWQYMSAGPGFRKVATGAAEGWRFVEGTGKPGDPAPRAPADPAATCPPAPATTTQPASPRPGGPQVSLPALPPLPSFPVVTGDASIPPASVAPPSGGGTPPDAAAGLPDAAAGVPDAARGTTPDGASTPGDAGAPTATGIGGEATPGDDADGATGATPPPEEVAGAPTAASADGGGGSPGAAIAVVTLMVVLGAAAALRFRRSPDA